MSESAVISVSLAARRVLEELASETHSSIEAVLEQAIETHRRQVFLDRTNEAFAALRQDDAAWREYATELVAWDATLRDGL